MSAFRDGPCSQSFAPLSFNGNSSIREVAELPVSHEMSAALINAPTGACVGWGIPLEINDVVSVFDQIVSIKIEPITAHWLVYMHTSDIRPADPASGGFVSHSRGKGRLSEHAADYVILYADGGEERVAIRRLHQVGGFYPAILNKCFEFAPLNHSCTYISGETTVKLPAGTVYIEVSKGFEFRPVRQIVQVNADTRSIVIEIERALPWRANGWVTADTHVHFLSPTSALLEGAAEGVNVINLLASQWGEWMTNVGDFDGKTTWGSAEAGGDGEYLVRVGTENRQHVLGHISLLGYRGEIIKPITSGGPDESALGDPVEVLLTE